MADTSKSDAQVTDLQGDSRPPQASTDSPGEVNDVVEVNASVQLVGGVSYLKSADPMPMLRPPDLIDPGEIGVVVERRALGICAVRFRRGTFLLEASRLRSVRPAPPR